MRESLRRLAGSGSTSEEGMARAGNDTKRVRVQLLDGEYISVDVDRKARGSDLLDRICDDLDIVERDYFGVVRANHTDRIWLDMERTLAKTFRNEPWEVRFVVKFYPPEPSELRDDNTRYQLGLAVRNDIMEGRLTCSYITHALLASYILQCELGDREARVSAAQLSAHRALPQHALTSDVEDKVDELYRKHKGQTPAEAELNYLENAKKLSLYGAELHRAKDSEDVDIALAVCWRGIAVLRDMVVMNRFPWTKIIKISYKKRVFTLRLRAGECDNWHTCLSFRLPATRACKNLWRCSVEHHIFFRREGPVLVERVSGFPRLGSRRVSCRRTLRQLRADCAQPHLVL
ncbi:protein 4.1 homolog [Papilio machaon]|nr:protein 4.1 homolog [Papilio machaon]XP_014365437.2 protein 4.1 homolog [Papilio machaon]